ncbi:MAG: monovalent cation:proton antiporter-2 (CPA2) family protein, partial [Deltaproteobacteria bacterium]|nr:monovalent cation:proton antiporter-2 (CPA2) family protein [Kofleriaceae bacterium]
MTDTVLFQAFVYLCAAVVCVPIAKKAGLGAVLGYLVAGVLIGPHVAGLVGKEGHHVMHFAEFGVVMMLFIVGLELQPQLLWKLRRPILGLGGLQVVVTTVLAAGGGLALGLDWRVALAVGMILSMSSTAIVLSTLTERNLLKTSGGQASFSVLLFQDIAVIPILAVFPLLGVAEAVSGGGGHGGGDDRPAWMTGLLVIGAVVGVVAAGRFIVRPMFQFLAAVKLRESFIAAALLIVVATAFLMQEVGLSPALGTFVAGVVLADSEYRHELESDIEPFKGLLLGLFFISVGAQIDFPLIGDEPSTIAGIVVGTMVLKLGVLLALGRLFELDRPSRWLLAMGLAEVGEFAFVLISFGLQNRIYGDATAGPLVAAVAISMLLTPFLFVALERWVLPAVTTDSADTRPHDEIAHEESPVVIAGFGRFGQVVGRMLRSMGVRCTVLDLDPEMVDVVRRLELKVYYGDASRVDLMRAAGCANAKLLVVAVDDPEQAIAIVETAKEHFPQLQIFARARDRIQYYELKRHGVTFAHRETFASAYETGIEVLRALGYRGHTAHRLARRWRQHEESELEEIAGMWARGEGRSNVFARFKRAVQEAERLMRDEDPQVFVERDGAWDNEALRVDRRPDDAG